MFHRLFGNRRPGERLTDRVRRSRGYRVTDHLVRAATGQPSRFGRLSGVASGPLVKPILVMRSVIIHVGKRLIPSGWNPDLSTILMLGSAVGAAAVIGLCNAIGWIMWEVAKH